MNGLPLLDPIRRRLRRIQEWPRRHVTYSIRHTLNGTDFTIPIMAGLGARNLKVHEPEVSALISALLALYPGPFLDVGVNIGQTLLKVVSQDRDRRYVGFEASPICCAYVERLIARNGLANCALVPVGLSDAPRMIDLHFSRDADGAATTVEHFWSGPNAKSLRSKIWVERGDTLIEALDLPGVAIIKIDVEGGELEVIAGLTGVIARHAPMLMIEVLPYSCDIPLAGGDLSAVENRKRRMARLVELIQDIGYAAFRYQPDGTLVETTVFDTPVYDAAMCNYLLVPKGRLAEVPAIEARYGAPLRGRAAIN